MKTNNKTDYLRLEVDDDHSPINFSRDSIVVEKDRWNGKEKEYPLFYMISLGLRLVKDKEVFNWFVNKDIDQYGEPKKNRRHCS